MSFYINGILTHFLLYIINEHDLYKICISVHLQSSSSIVHRECCESDLDLELISNLHIYICVSYGFVYLCLFASSGGQPH